VARAIRDADAKTAGAWIRAAGDDHADDRARTLYRMLATHLDRDFLEQLVFILLDPSPAAEAVREATPGFAVDALVKRLGEEEDRSQRRLLIDALSAVAAVDSVPFVKHLNDDRWYLVRNIVVILGRAGHTDVAEMVRPALRHEEPRVRREALRTMYALAGDDSVPDLIAALEDDSNSVRRQALFLLRTPPDPAVDDALARYIKTDLPIGERLKIMDVLAARGTESARAVLRSYASIQLGFTSTSRTLRAAARRALGRNS
jgi:HEAT repeat protein